MINFLMIPYKDLNCTLTIFNKQNKKHSQKLHGIMLVIFESALLISKAYSNYKIPIFLAMS